MKIIFDVVKNITGFMILVTVIFNLFGNKEYRKYVSIFVGMILILIVVGPILTWIQGEDVLSGQIILSGFAIDNSDLENEIKIADEEGREKIFLTYKEQIQTQVGEVLKGYQLHVKKINIELDEDVRSEGFGRIIGLTISATKTQESRGEEKITIDRIQINDEGEVEENDQGGNLSTNLMSEQIIKELSTLYRIEPDNIRIKVTG